MAYSCVKVSFEIGHEASLRNKRTLEGFTHDWEVFVRGSDNTDISQFVDRVVFYLHETFPKPKRVLKEPPYSVKESGYAGFLVPIDIYFKNQDEPKKVRFEYDLQLQTTGPPISKVLREKFVFPNPPEDLRRRLIRGGGVGVTSSGETSRFVASPDKSLPTDDVPTVKQATPLVGKPKLGGDVGKKQKIKDYKLDEPPRVNDQFANLFGTPIHTTKVSPDPKKSSSTASKTQDKLGIEKHLSGGKSSKHIPQKDTGNSKDEPKERSKDREKNKDKTQKRISTPPKKSQSPKRASTPPKRSTTPSKRPSSPKRPLTPKLKDENRKIHEDPRSKADTKSSDKKKKEKKSKDDKSEKKKNEKKSVDSKVEKSSEVKEKEKKLPKEIANKDVEKTKQKHSDSDKDKEKQRHKHKKKDRNKVDDGEKEKSREKVKSSKKSSDKVLNDVKEADSNSLDREPVSVSTGSTTTKKKACNEDSMSPARPKLSPVKRSLTPDKSTSSKEKAVKHPLKLLLAELTDHESSDSNNSSSSEEDDSYQQSTSKKLAKSSENFNQSSAAKTIQSIEDVVNSFSLSPPNNKIQSTKSKTSYQESYSLTSHNGKQKDKSEMKRKRDKKEPVEKNIKDEAILDKETTKRKGKSIVREEPPEKIAKKSTDAMMNEPTQITAASETVAVEAEKPLLVTKQKDSTIPEQVKAGNTVEERFTADYVAQLKELQQKIMTLEDNDELQRVVRVIAETGQYEITKKTFDFDLCALDQMTVKRLQDFFIAT